MTRRAARNATSEEEGSMYCIRITGKRGVEYAEAHGVPIARAGTHFADGPPDGFRAALTSDEDWDAAADDGEQVYVDAPSPFAVARYDANGALVDLEYHQSIDEARDAFGQAQVPTGGGAACVRLVAVDEDGAPDRSFEERS